MVQSKCIHLSKAVALLLLAATSQAQESPNLPEPYATQSVSKNSRVVGWPEGKTPIAPKGFEVSVFAKGLANPRWLYVAPNGDVFVAESGTRIPKQKRADETDAFFKSKSQNFGSANRVTLFRDQDKDGIYESKYAYLTGQNQPFGMLIFHDSFYVANTDEVLQFPYNPADTTVSGPGKSILSLPGQGYNNHWTRNIVANPQQTKLYVSVGSASNIADHGMDEEKRRADILEINPDGSSERIYASGLRNPVGLDWQPGTNILWTAVNERDLLGDDLVPDYTTSVKDGGFYGWPYSYYGQHEDPRLKGQNPGLVSKALVPDVPLGAHTASLGLSFYKAKQFPKKYQGGMFVGQHGSWNRSVFSGYKVVYIPFTNGKPGKPEDFLTGFIADETKNEVYGRPVGVTVMPDGSLLVADDAAKTVWKITYKK